MTTDCYAVMSTAGRIIWQHLVSDAWSAWQLIPVHDLLPELQCSLPWTQTFTSAAVQSAKLEDMQQDQRRLKARIGNEWCCFEPSVFAGLKLAACSQAWQQFALQRRICFCPRHCNSGSKSWTASSCRNWKAKGEERWIALRCVVWLHSGNHQELEESCLQADEQAAPMIWQLPLDFSNWVSLNPSSDTGTPKGSC